MNFLSIFFRANTTMLLLLLATACSGPKDIPAEWLTEWENPSALYRPLQLVHGQDLRAPQQQQERKGWDSAAYYRDSCGLGGVVCNVPFGADYLTSEANWEMLVDGVRYMLDNGLRIWIYDEDGYPSLGAGGLVLKNHPELEAQELVYDPTASDPLIVRPSFEYTHASNNYYASRRYPNPLNPAATQEFIRLTYDAYFDHLGPELYQRIEAFFTDEPSLMAVNPGPIPDEVRANLREQDRIDPNKKMLPMVSWADDLPQKYQARYGEELDRKALFEGDTEKAKETRQRFWALVAETDRAYFYDAIRKWCEAKRQSAQGKGPVFSGHSLREEDLSHHVPFDGNKLLTLSGMELPGLDMLDSDPETWQGRSWLAAYCPISTAALNGQRRVMCEISDFQQSVFGDRPVGLEQMRGACAWQMAFGVTDFTLYYGVSLGEKYPWRNPATHKAYCDFIGRINALIMEAEPQRDVLLYYPIYDMQREYIPTATPIDTTTQSPLLRRIETAFNRIGNALSQAQIPFILADYLFLEQAELTPDGKLKIGPSSYGTLIFPEGVVLPDKIEVRLSEWEKQGVKIVRLADGETPSCQEWIERLQPLEFLSPERRQIALGKFRRADHDIYMVVNSSEEPYQGTLRVSQSGEWQRFDPQTGEVSVVMAGAGGELPLDMAGNQTQLFVSR